MKRDVRAGTGPRIEQEAAEVAEVLADGHLFASVESFFSWSVDADVAHAAAAQEAKGPEQPKDHGDDDDDVEDLLDGRFHRDVSVHQPEQDSDDDKGDDQTDQAHSIFWVGSVGDWSVGSGPWSVVGDGNGLLTTDN